MEPVTVTLISWWNHPFRDILPAFNDIHPDIQVEFTDSGTGYGEKVMTAMVSGSELTDIVGSQDYNLPSGLPPEAWPTSPTSWRPTRTESSPTSSTMASTRARITAFPGMGPPASCTIAATSPNSMASIDRHQ